MKPNLEKICKTYKTCPDKKICDGYGNLNLGRYEQYCSNYKKEVKKWNYKME